MSKFKNVNPKQSFPEIESEVLKFWKENKTFEKSIESRPKENVYRFYDWPPFITWTPHYWSLLSSICKDVVPRYQTMQWKRVERRWGWDAHGIAIEDKVQKKMWISSSKEIEKVWVENFIKECYNYTKQTSDEWEWYIDHIWRWVDFKNSYKTMDQSYMESVLRVFKILYDKNLIYKWKRCSQYSWKLSTPISNFEIAMDDSYKEVNNPVITIMFQRQDKDKEYFLAWTTTPWTIPANMALAVNKDLEYSRVLFDDKYFFLASARVEDVFKGKEYEIIETFKWDKLLWIKYMPPFAYYSWKINEEKNHIVYHADFITESDWTGIAHQAPEFWDVDFELAQNNWIHITNALDDEWNYTNEIDDMFWIHYLKANEIIPEKLKEKWILFKKESITHRVAMCPRTDTPLIYKVQSSWFVNVQLLKKRMKEENEFINWVPEHLKNGQFLKSMEQAPDWCISRTRYWGSPMPIWIGYDKDWNEKDMIVFGSKKEIEERSWQKIVDLHKPYIDEIIWEEKGLTYKRTPEVLDCWLESWSMPYAQMHYPFDNKKAMEESFPADFIVEYIWQVRAWFYVMHVLWVALFDKRSFTNVITTGIVYWSDGRKMSKSYKNYPDPKYTIENYGADAIRFYIINSPLLSWWNMSFMEEWVKEVVKKVILPVWNTYYFFTTYANIDNFDPKKDLINQKENNLDIWIKSELNELIKNVTQSFEDYKLNESTKLIVNFIENLTNWYIRRSRRRFWKSWNDLDKTQAYSTLYEVLTNLLKLLAPFTPFVTEHIYKELTKEESIHLSNWPQYYENKIYSDLNEEMRLAQNIVSLWLSWRAKNKIRTRQPLNFIKITKDLDDYYKNIIKDELNIKNVIVSYDLATKIAKPDWRKIWPKYWKEVQGIIKNAKNWNFEELENWKIKVFVDKTNFILEKDEYVIEFISADENLNLESWFWLVVAMDEKITNELLKEWYARDVIRLIQESRKELNYNVDDRINIFIEWDQFINEVLYDFKDYIELETLSKINKIKKPDLKKEFNIEENNFSISLKK